MMNCSRTREAKRLEGNLRPTRSLHARLFKRISTNPIPKKTDQDGRWIAVCLLYNKHRIQFKVKQDTPFAELNRRLYAELNEHLIRIQGNKTSKVGAILRSVLGFQSTDGDVNFDYRLSVGRGELKKTKFFRVFQQRLETRPNTYKIYKCLAIGGFSKVYLARSYEDGRFYAIKFILKSKEDAYRQQFLRNQVEICRDTDHPFLVKLHHAFQGKLFYALVFEYCPGGELFFLLRKVKKMSESTAKFYFLQILYGIEHLHSKSVIYRDLKPENILIDQDGNCKIVDFGLSKRVDARSKTFSYCGSAEYMAPEMILRSGHSMAIDFYSLGALLYELVTGLPPFYSKNQTELQDSIVFQKLQFPEHIELSTELKDLLQRLLKKDERQRLGCYAGAREILFHPWTGKVNSASILGKKIACPFPTTLEEYNFDEDELGEDEAEFTRLVLSEINSIGKNQAYFDQIYKRAINSKLNDSEVSTIIQSNIKTQKENEGHHIREKSLFKPREVKESFAFTGKDQWTLRTLELSEKGRIHKKSHMSSLERKQRSVERLFPYFQKQRLPKKPVRQEEEGSKIRRFQVLRNVQH